MTADESILRQEPDAPQFVLEVEQLVLDADVPAVRRWDLLQFPLQPQPFQCLFRHAGAVVERVEGATALVVAGAIPGCRVENYPTAGASVSQVISPLFDLLAKFE
jgi:hypothetical protein